jgi:hypothetical protein
MPNIVNITKTPYLKYPYQDCAKRSGGTDSQLRQMNACIRDREFKFLQFLRFSSRSCCCCIEF